MATKKKKESGFKPYNRSENLMQMSEEELKKEYKRVAAAADKRLQRLKAFERSGKMYSEHATSFAYAGAKKLIKQLKGENAKVFGKALLKGKPKRSYVAAINQIYNFLDKPTSTVRGIRQTYGKSLNTFNKRFGINLTMDQYASYFEDGIHKALAETIGSDQVVRLLRKIKPTKEKIIKELSKSNIIRSKEKITPAELDKLKWDDLVKLAKKYNVKYVDKRNKNWEYIQDQISRLAKRNSEELDQWIKL